MSNPEPPEKEGEPDPNRLPVPPIDDPGQLAKAEAEESELFPGHKAAMARMAELQIRRFELENDRLEKANAREHEREKREMSTRHQLARFIVWVLCPGWLLLTLGIILCTGLKLVVLSDPVLLGLVSANPLGIAGVLWIVVSYFFPKRPN